MSQARSGSVDLDLGLDDGAATQLSARPISQRSEPSGEHTQGAAPATLDQFEIGEKLGAGGMAAVFRALDKKTGHEVALKIVENGDDDPSRRTRFEREVRSAGGLVHENVCRVLSFGRAPGKLFMAMELVTGPTLQRVVKLKGTLPLPVALEAMRQLLGALSCAGKAGVVHRDLKPANIMIMPDGTLKLLDFGIAKSQEDATVTATGLLIGTPAYMSPEQILGGVVDGRSDLFSAGVALLVMLTGRARFHGLDPAAVMVKVTTEPVPSLLEEAPTASSAADRFLARICAQNLDARFQTADEALEALAKVPEAPPIHEGKALLVRYMNSPDAVVHELCEAGKARELARADKLLKRGEAALPAAALALYRAQLLSPSPDVKRRLDDACARGNILFDVDDPDPKIKEAKAAFAAQPHAPGVVKRLADLYKARGHVLLAAAFLTRYLRIKPTDSHAAQQLQVLLDGPDGDTNTNDRLNTRDIMSGIKTGGFVEPNRMRNTHVPGVQGPLTAAGLRPASPAVAVVDVTQGLQRTMALPTGQHSPAQTAALQRAQGPRGTSSGQPQQVIIHTQTQMRTGVSGLNPLFLLVGAVVVAGLVLAFLGKFVKSTVDDVQMTMSDNEQRVGALERNNIERLRLGYISEARAQLDSGSPQQAVRQINLLLATNPAAETALEGLFLRAQARIKLKDNRSARVDLEEYLAQSTLSDPRRPEVKKTLEALLLRSAGAGGGGDPSIAPSP